MSGDLPIQSHGVFEHYERPPCLDIVEKHLVQLVTGLLKHPLLHLDARPSKRLQPFACNQRVGIGGTDHHPPDARFQNGVHAGRLLPLVATGFQRHIERCSPRGFATGS